MLKRGGYDVTIVDKSDIIPAPDAASTGENFDSESDGSGWSIGVAYLPLQLV